MKSCPTTPLCIYVDHGEAYGNLGDEAMLLSALDRLDEALGPCQFVLPAEVGKPLPDLSDYHVTLIPSPRRALVALYRLLRGVIHVLGRLPYAGRICRRMDESLIWRLATALVSCLLMLHRLRIWPWVGPTLRSFVDACRRCDAFYGVGAADFNDYNLPGVIYKCWLYRTVRSRVRVSAVSAQGCGPLVTPWARSLMKQAFESVDLLSFRDCQYSAELVESLRLMQGQRAIVGDEAFSLQPADPEEVTAFLRQLDLRPGQPFIACHWRWTDYTQETTHLIPRVAALLDTICALVPYPLVFFPLSYDVHSRLDIVCGWAVRGAMRLPHRMIIAPMHTNVRLVKGAVGAARYTLGLSYHLHVFALSQGHPVLILYSGTYYRYKSEGLIGFYGPPCAALDIESALDSDVMHALRSIEDSYSETCKSIHYVNKNLLYMNTWTIESMKNTLCFDVQNTI